jgi:hypothetical protein
LLEGGAGADTGCVDATGVVVAAALFGAGGSSTLVVGIGVGVTAGVLDDGFAVSLTESLAESLALSLTGEDAANVTAGETVGPAVESVVGVGGTASAPSTSITIRNGLYIGNAL